ncbi:MAG: ABC transporter permease [Hyphomicrobiales bacterium]|nr:ABC transporter permease [Hyphomicrobiales bacterium]
MSQTSPTPNQPNMVAANKVKSIRRLDLATSRQLMWYKFKRHKLAMIGTGIIFVFLLLSIFPEFISTTKPQLRDPAYSSGPPTGIHIFDEEWQIHWPFIYGHKMKRHPVTLRKLVVLDTDTRVPIEFFVRGEAYKFLGFIPADLHLFGTLGTQIHLFGTDKLGRDIFSRTIYATRVSMSIGIIGVMAAFFIGLAIGGLAGLKGGWVDNVIMRLIEFIRSIPSLPLWLGLAASLPREWSATTVYVVVTLILAALGWTTLARRVRSKLLTLQNEDFIQAARLAGCSNYRLVTKHMLPSFMSYLIVDLTVAFPYILLAETSLSFLGLGMREPMVSWGVLLFSAQNVTALAHTPWLLIPGGFILVIVIAFNFFGDGMRDAADPYTK